MKSSLHTSRATSAAAYDPRVCAYIATAPSFAKPILEHIREIVHKATPQIEETIKWSRPFFMHRGVILGNMSAFTAHCSFGLWGTEIGGVLRQDGVDASDSSGSFGRLTSIKDLPPDETLIGYVQHAVALCEKPPVKTAAKPAPKPRSLRLPNLSPPSKLGPSPNRTSPRSVPAAVASTWPGSPKPSGRRPATVASPPPSSR